MDKSTGHDGINLGRKSAVLLAIAAYGVLAVITAFPVTALEMATPQQVPVLFDPASLSSDKPSPWYNGRRKEIKRMLEENVYGKRPVERPPHLVFTAAEPDKVMMDGKALRKRIRVEYGGSYGTNSFIVTAFIPRSVGRAPAFLFGCNRNPAEHLDPERGVKSGFWPAEEIVSRGYAAIAFYLSDLSPDKNHGNTRGVFAAFSDVERQYRPSNEWGMISAWAWGASRVLDWIETEPMLDAKRVAVIGHSRGGKTALVAAAWDERFAMTCSNESGCGGAKMLHVDLPDSEHIVNSITGHQFWYCRNYTRWVNRDLQTPWGQHMLVALIAPRFVCIGSAAEDRHAGPYGEYCTALHASPVWTDIYGKKGFVSNGFPEIGHPQQDGDISYHIRAGRHDLTPEDWRVYMDFADRHLR